MKTKKPNYQVQFNFYERKEEKEYQKMINELHLAKFTQHMKALK